jgi:N,N-dimethylformamidase beta subunit-like protein
MAAIEGYASLTSAAPGDIVNFCVRADQTLNSFTLEIYRRGLSDRLVETRNGTAFTPGAQDDARLAATGCGWPPAAGCQITIPSAWTNGYYVGKLISADQVAWIPFVVRTAVPGAKSKILVKINDTTTQAYNAWGGRSLYSSPFAPRISFDRPYADLNLYEDYQLPFLRWAEANGFELEYCSAVDLHTNPRLLESYRLLLSFGHDEYWSWEMRDQVEAFIGNGGNVGFFCGNTCWWQIRFDFTNGGRIMVCYKETDAVINPGHIQDPQRQPPERITVHWHEPPVLRPENSMTGVSYRTGAGMWDPHPIVPDQRYRGYRVTNAAHWVFRGTGVADGDEFGKGTSVDNTIIGYETDAAHIVPGSAPARLVGDDGTPKNFVVLATADLSDWAPPDAQRGKATMGLYQRHGTVFTAATVNWAGGLSRDGNWTPVDQITKNLLRGLSGTQAPGLEIANSGFELWDDSVPAGWALDGAGRVSAERAEPDTSFPNIRNDGGGHFSLKVDASAGETWISQSGLLCAAETTYGVGCWAKAYAPGATIRLQTTDTWTDFIMAAHTGSGNWEYLFAVGSRQVAPPLFPARVKIQVAGGLRAWFENVVIIAIPGHPGWVDRR